MALDKVPAAMMSGLLVSETAPSNPGIGQRWYKASTAVTYQYTNDGTSSFWLDVSSGGIIVALSEMCLAGNIGSKIKISNKNIDLQEYLFAEDQSRYLIEITEKNKKNIYDILNKKDIFHEVIAKTNLENFEVEGHFNIKLTELRKINSDWFNKYNS